MCVCVCEKRESMCVPMHIPRLWLCQEFRHAWRDAFFNIFLKSDHRVTMCGNEVCVRGGVHLPESEGVFVTVGKGMCLLSPQKKIPM